MSTEQLAAWNAREASELKRVSSLDIRAGSTNQSNETGETISDERKKVLCGLGKARTPQERAFQSAFIKQCGYDQWPVKQLKLVDDNDYEGAILARQEIYYI